MHFYIRRDTSDEGLGSEVPAVPGKLLARHGARMSRTATAPSGTAYRADVLRVPPTVDREVVEQSLADINLKLAGADPAESGHRPPVVRLEARDPGKPARVDAWYALEHLREKATGEQVALEHLLFLGLDPAPWDSHGIDPAPWDSHGLYGRDSYLRSARGGPVPVSMSVRPPRARPLVAGSGFDRRPVIAVLDTGISAHEWFGTTDRDTGFPPGGFIRVLKEVQDAITASSREAGTGARVIEDYWDEDVAANPLTGELDRHVGHGTFIAGIVRQVAPDSEVGVARVMAGDGVAYESDVLAALERLVEQVRAAQAPGGNPADMIDILSISIGYYCETIEDEAETTEFARLLGELSDLGVLVVAAAGNDATTRPFFPAALAVTPPAGGGQPVLSVGALNPNGTKAFFSNQAPWVHAWATGAAVVSTFPTLRGSTGPANAIRELDRESLDPDDFTSGFAMWHGTSFAGPHAAAALANRLIEQADTDPDLRMGRVSQEAMRERARRAVASCPGC
ncbi:S8 family peptidase [Actinophytocola glycyrrhizae]|uniref:S8 family serine peptidase n=1 Tax=Actinophytocola glycyrrhizae TaxID=2044873 RepID=A0ABV9RU51_9PSEU